MKEVDDKYKDQVNEYCVLTRSISIKDRAPQKVRFKCRSLNQFLNVV